MRNDYILENIIKETIEDVLYENMLAKVAIDLGVGYVTDALKEKFIHWWNGGQRNTQILNAQKMLKELMGDGSFIKSVSPEMAKSITTTYSYLNQMGNAISKQQDKIHKEIIQKHWNDGHVSSQGYHFPRK